MRLTDILSKSLPEIDESVKECVNLGEWLLFKSEKPGSDNDPQNFYLKTDSSVFELDCRGGILKEMEDGTESLEVDELFYFSDVYKPESISNTKIKNNI